MTDKAASPLPRDSGDEGIPAFEDDPVAMALGLTPHKPGVVLPGDREHCATCAADWALADYVARVMALTEPDNSDSSGSA